MSPSIPRQVRWKLFAHTPPPAAAFPEERAGRLLRYVFRGLLDVYSHCNLHAHRVAKTTLYTEGSSGFVTSAAASVITGWNEPVPGWGYLPLKSTGFPRRTAPRTLLRFLATTGPSATLSSSIDFLGSPVIRLPAPPISRRDEEGFSSCLAHPCHRAAANTPPECSVASVSCAGPCCLRPFGAGSAPGVFGFRGHLCVHFRCGPMTRSPSQKMALSIGFIRFVSSANAILATGS